MKVSARNRLLGTVVELEFGAVMANVKVNIGNDNVITSLISKESALELGLELGKEVFIMIKSTNVIVGVEN